MRYFERVLERMDFKFIPIFSTDNGEIFGYRVVKDFSTLGFDDKEYMYQMASEKKVFDEFALKMIEKAGKEILEKGIKDKYFLYTLRFNFIDNPLNFFKSLNIIIKELRLNPKSFIFDVKGINNWKEFHKEYDSVFNFNIVLKESKDSQLNIATLEKSQANFIEPKSIDTLAFMKKNINLSTPLIYNLSCEKDLKIEFLKKLGVDYYYTFIRK